MSVTVANLCVGPATVEIGTDLGATVGGVTITREPEILRIIPEQCTGPVKTYMTSEAFTIAFESMELTDDNLDLLFFGGDGSMNASASPASFGGDDSPEEHTDLIVHGTKPGGASASRDIAFEKVVLVEPGDWTIGKESVHTVGTKFLALCDAADGSVGTVDDS